MIINRISQEQFQTAFSRIIKDDLPLLQKEFWLFDWKKEIKTADRVVYKLTTRENPTVIQGLISCSDFGDHMFVNLIESASFNRDENRL